MKLGKRGVEDRVEYDWSETEDETPGRWPFRKRQLAEASASDDPGESDFPDVDAFDEFEDEEELASEIEITLLHEIGNYYSLSDEELDRLGLE